MKVEGKILVIGETETFGNNGFRKRDLVVETEEQYKQQIPISFVQDKADLLDSYKVGQDVIVSINIRGNSWEKEGVTRYFASIQGWRIEASNSEMKQASEKLDQAFEPSSELPTEENDDLPF